MHTCPPLLLPSFLTPSLLHMQTAASVVQEQAEADEDTSLQQRLLMGAGTTLEGASELTDNEIASGQPL